jgi:hypothetical protein
MSIGRIATSQIQAPPPVASSGSPAAPGTASLAALNLTAPQQSAVNAVIAAFEAQNGGAQPTATQFQSLVAQISRYLTSTQQAQLQQLIGSATGGRASAVATSDPTLSEFDLINGNNSGSMELMNYLDGGSGSVPSASDPSISASLWNFGAMGTPVQNALLQGSN